MRTASQPFGNQQGIVLITTLLLLILLTGIGLTSLATFDTNRSLSQSQLATKQAFNLADAGIRYAGKYLNQHQPLWASYASASPQTLIPATTLSGLGTFTVTVQDGGSGSLQITSTGATTTGAQSAIIALIALGPYVPEDALTTDQTLAISANMTVSGTNGGVHSNGSLTITASPTISANATAFGAYSASATAHISGVTGSRLYDASIPLMHPLDFRASADYILSWDGNVYTQAGVVQPLDWRGYWYCWQFSNLPEPAWTMVCDDSTDALISGTLYFETDAVINSGPGSFTTWVPLVGTIIAEGDIVVNGNMIALRAPMPSDGALFNANTRNLLFLSGGDVKIAGGSRQRYQGIIVAAEQLSIQVPATISGYLLAQDLSNSSGTVTSNSIIDAVALTYNGDYPAPATLQKTASVLTWKVQ